MHRQNTRSSFQPPREGLTSEYLFLSPLKNTSLQPLLTGPLLLFVLLSRYTPFVSSQNSRTETIFLNLLARLPSFIKNRRASRTILWTTTFLFSVGLARKISIHLSHWTLNNWIRDDDWEWERKGDREGELVLVTGGSGGLGRLIVEGFAERGIDVLSVDLAIPEGKVEGKRGDSGQQHIWYYKADITGPESIKELEERITAEHGRGVSVLINNAGTGHSHPILHPSSTPSAIQRVFAVNTISHFLLARAFVPAMIKENHGHVVTVASMASFVVHAGNVDYACTKASTLAFHEGLSQELRLENEGSRVRTSIVHPSWIRTPMLNDVLAKPEFKEFVLEPETVAERTVEQVLSGYGAQIILPERLGWVTAARGFPSWMQEGMRNGVRKVLN